MLHKRLLRSDSTVRWAGFAFLGNRRLVPLGLDKTYQTQISEMIENKYFDPGMTTVGLTSTYYRLVHIYLRFENVGWV